MAVKKDNSNLEGGMNDWFVEWYSSFTQRLICVCANRSWDRTQVSGSTFTLCQYSHNLCSS